MCIRDEMSGAPTSRRVESTIPTIIQFHPSVHPLFISSLHTDALVPFDHLGILQSLLFISIVSYSELYASQARTEVYEGNDCLRHTHQLWLYIPSWHSDSTTMAIHLAQGPSYEDQVVPALRRSKYTQPLAYPLSTDHVYPRYRLDLHSRPRPVE